jgi:glutathione S-transferase
VHFFIDTQARKKSGLKYPVSYATPEEIAKNPAAYQFNCAQRAHLNFTENHTSFLTGLLISGLSFPLVSASLGAAWSLARLHYALGYTSGQGPKGRIPGSAISLLSDFALKAMATYSTLMFVVSK